MRFFIYDTETTGLKGKDEVIQFSGFLTDTNFRKIDIVNFYAYTEKTIDPKAQAVHRIDKNMLWHLSKGKTFEEQIYTYDFLCNDSDLIFIGYNVSFDNRMVNQTLRNNGFTPIDFGSKVNTLCEVKTGRHYYDLMMPLSHYLNNGVRMKLSEAIAKITSRSISELNGIYKFVFDRFGVPEGTTIETMSLFHNSLYDSFMSWVLLNEFGTKINSIFRM